jgi:predicted ATPase/class 3 adenylate cyclase
MVDPPTGTVTFLFTDIEGSTRLWERHPDEMRHALARHDSLLRHACESCDGYVFKTVGDAFHVAFAEAPRAVAAALLGQLALLAEPWPEATPLRVRMALHTGTAEARDNDYFGPTLNHCARLLDVAYGGQTLLSDAAHELVLDGLPGGASLRDLGVHRLTDLRRPERIFQLVHPRLPLEFPLLRTLDALPNNLPVRRSSFVGRESEMAAIRQLQQAAPLLTLTGAGGAGKTRLALQVAASLLSNYRDGVWLVDMAPLVDPDLLVQRVATVLRVSEEAGQDLVETLIDYLRVRQVLLLLDNCEHLVDACARLAERLLESCPDLRILATSREPLGIEAETTYEVPSLALPATAPAADLAPAEVRAIGRAEAVRLFVDRAQAVAPDFRLTGENAESVAEVCRQLDGLPLAIELAAARVKVMTVGQIVQRLDDRFSLLTGGSRTVLPRQQTLRALIDWSYDLLDAEERTVLRRLSVFRGGWTLEAAEAICADTAIQPTQVLDYMTALVAKSMVKVDDRVEVVRYGMLLTVRDYAWEKLLSSGEAAAVRDRHAAWFLDLAEEAAPALTGRQQAAWLDRLDLEHDNLRAMMEWLMCATPGPDRLAPAAPAPATTAMGLRLVSALQPYWEQRGFLVEGRDRLADALAMPGAERSPDLRARALIAAGVLAAQQGDYDDARQLSEDGLTIARANGDNAAMAAALTNLGTVSQYQGDFQEARRQFETALSLSQAVDDRGGVGTALLSLGVLAREQGEYVAATHYLGQGLALRRELGDERGMASFLNALATLAFGRGDYEAARAQYEEALSIVRSLGDRRSVALVLSNLGRVASAQGDLSTARSLLEESLTFRRQIGERRGMANALNSLGLVARREGNIAAAQALARESLVTRRELGDLPGIAESLETWSTLAADAGHLTTSVRLSSAAAALRVSIGAPLAPSPGELECDRLGDVRSAMGDEAFAAAWEGGRQLPWNDAVDEALCEARQVPAGCAANSSR